MQKKKKHWKRYLFMIILLGIYAIRVIFVNADNDKARVHYVNEKETARTKNMEISISDATLYDTPAFLAKYKNTTQYFSTWSMYYRNAGNLDSFVKDKYILCARMTLKNSSKKLRDIDLTTFHIYIGEGYHNGVPQDLFGSLNGFGGLSIRPGHVFSFTLVYTLNELNIKKEIYDDLANQDISILVSGYPNIQRIRLNSIKYEKASEKQRDYYDQLVGVGYEPIEWEEDTKEGTMQEIGGTYCEKGVTFSVDSYDISRKVDVKKLKGDDKETLQHYLDKKGNVIRGLNEEDAVIVWIRLHVKNLSGQEQIIPIQPGLVKYNGHETDGNIYAEAGEHLQFLNNSSLCKIEEGTDSTVLLGYLVEDNVYAKDKAKWKPEKRALYLNFAIGAYEDVDFKKGEYSYGKFLRVK